MFKICSLWFCVADKCRITSCYRATEIVCESSDRTTRCPQVNPNESILYTNAYNKLMNFDYPRVVKDNCETDWDHIRKVDYSSCSLTQKAEDVALQDTEESPGSDNSTCWRRFHHLMGCTRYTGPSQCCCEYVHYFQVHIPSSSMYLHAS